MIVLNEQSNVQRRRACRLARLSSDSARRKVDEQVRKSTPPSASPIAASDVVVNEVTIFPNAAPITIDREIDDVALIATP